MTARVSAAAARKATWARRGCARGTWGGCGAIIILAALGVRISQAGEGIVKNDATRSGSRTLLKPAPVGKARRAGADGKPGRAPGTASRVRLALAGDATPAHPATTSGAAATRAADSKDSDAEHAIARALRLIGECQSRYQTVVDYTCTFYKRERIDGQMSDLHVMRMKVRTAPRSIYLKFQQPAAGREAIYIVGRNGGKILAHDVGLNKLLGGTIELEPTGARAMENCRHPISEAGIGPLLDTLERRWSEELSPENSVLTFHDDMLVGPYRCTMIESTHPAYQRHFLYHKVRVFIDQAAGLPIRFEAYDWPKARQSAGALAEEYSYMNLKLNVGLRDIDFDVANPNYSFGRF
jgi:hypothetical protein